jgi:gamma-glutamyltranspeptidase
MSTPGPSRITTTLSRGWINFAMEGMVAKNAIRAPRFHVENIDDGFTLQYYREQTPAWPEFRSG